MVECIFCGHKNEVNAKACAKCNSRIMVDIPEENIDTDVLKKGEILFDRYEIEGLLNAGGMGAVYKAYDLRFDKKIFAVKELLDTSLDAKEKANSIRRFKREANILSTLRHKYLPQVIDFFTIGNKYYLVMDYVDGYDLEALVNAEGALEEEWLIEMMLQVCDVLDYLHTQNPPIIYRDLKPSNIMVDNKDGNIRLVDFGIARSIEGEYGTSTRIGSVGYASPEHYNGIPDNRSDIYSLGVTMHSLLTGLSPDVTFSFEDVNIINPKISARLNNIVMKAMRLKPEERFQDIKDLQRALAGHEEIIIEDAKEYKQLEALSAQLNVNNPELKKQVIKSISDLKISRAVYPLLKILQKDDDWRIRKEAALALKNFKTGTTDLTRKLSEIYEKETNSKVKATIIRVLGICKTKGAVDLLISSLDTSDDDLRLRAIIALGEIGDRKALEPLCRILNDDSSSLQEDARISIEKIDPKFLDSWLEKRAIKNEKKNNIENIKLVVFIAVLLLICLVGLKYGLDYKNEVEIEDKFKEGTEFFELGNYNKAIEALGFVIQKKPEDAGALCWLGKAYLKNKNYNEAINVLEKAIRIDDTLAEGYVNLGIAYFYNDNTKKAKDILALCKEKFPEAAPELESYIFPEENNSLTNNKLSSYKGSFKEYDKTLRAYTDQGRYDEVISLCSEIIDENNGSPAIYAYRANAYVEKEEYENAKSDLELLVKRSPENLDYKILLSHTYLSMKEFDSAIKYSNNAINISPSTALPYLIRGVAYFEKGNYKYAKDDLEMYIKLDSNGDYVDIAKNYLKALEK